MADLLSQNEIDILLDSLAKGNFDNLDFEKTESSKVKVYDFKSANKFSKEHFKILHNIYENFSQLVSTYFSGALRTNCQVEVASVEEQIYYDYINSLPTPVILAIMDSAPMGSPSLIEFSPVISYELINRLLGGQGAASEPIGTYTEIDLALLERTFLHLTKLIDDSWSKVIKVKTIFERIETSPQFAQITSYNETIAIITLKVTIGGSTEGFINVCIPHIAIEPIAEKLNTKLWYTNERLGYDPENTKYLRQKIASAKVDFIVAFHDISIKVGEMLNLEVGDVLQLTHKVDDKMVVKIDNIIKFKGELGTMKNKYVVRITDSIKGDDIDNDWQR